MSVQREFYCLASPDLAKENAIYGSVEWYDKFQDAEVEGISFESKVCSLESKHHWVGERIGDLKLVLPTLRMGDFIWTVYSECVVTEQVLKIFQAAGLSGFQAQRAEIIKVKRRRKDDQSPFPRVWELKVTGNGGDARPDSGIRLLYVCSSCGLTRYSSFQNGITVDEEKWDGSDFFTVNGYPKYTLITERVKDLIIANKLNNCAIIRSRDLQWGNSPRPEDHPENFIPGRTLSSIR